MSLSSGFVVASRPMYLAGQGSCLIQSVLTNHTGHGEKDSFPVVTAVTFRDLTLIYKFADGARSAVPLFDKNHLRRTELDAPAFYLQSAPVPVRHADHGRLAKIILRGYFSATILHIQTAETAIPFVTHVTRDFEFKLSRPSTDNFLPLYAVTRDGRKFGVGTLSIVDAVEPNIVSNANPNPSDAQEERDVLAIEVAA